MRAGVNMVLDHEISCYQQKDFQTGGVCTSSRRGTGRASSPLYNGFDCRMATIPRNYTPNLPQNIVNNLGGLIIADLLSF